MSSFGVMRLSGSKSNILLGMYTYSGERFWTDLVFENHKSNLSFLAKYYNGASQIGVFGINLDFEDITDFPAYTVYGQWTPILKELSVTSTQFNNIDVSQYKYIAIMFRQDGRGEIQNIEWQ